MPRRAPLPGRVALRSLDLDDLASEISEDHGGVGPGDDAREVDDSLPLDNLH